MILIPNNTIFQALIHKSIFHLKWQCYLLHDENVITLEDKNLLKIFKDEENNLQKEIDEENNGNCFKFLNF